MHARQLSALLLAVVLAFGLGACGGESREPGDRPSGADVPLPLRPDPANRGKTVTIGSKDFTESEILARIYGQALERAGYTVRFDMRVGDESAVTEAMRMGKVDGYPEYTGTALTALLDVAPGDVPDDEDEAFQEARRRYERKLGFVALPQTPFTNSNALGMTAAKARELGNPRTISELTRAHNGELSLAAPEECFEREDCAPGFTKVYGLRFSREIPIEAAERHEAILEGRADLTIPFTTDGQIIANGEVVLEDDKDLFPPYNVTFVLTGSAARRLGPNAEKVILAVQRGLTTPVMQELNSRVDLDEQSPEQVATDYLRAERFVP